jgi:hypothetical protein
LNSTRQMILKLGNKVLRSIVRAHVGKYESTYLDRRITFVGAQVRSYVHRVLLRTANVVVDMRASR